MAKKIKGTWILNDSIDMRPYNTYGYNSTIEVNFTLPDYTHPDYPTGRAITFKYFSSGYWSLRLEMNKSDNSGYVVVIPIINYAEPYSTSNIIPIYQGFIKAKTIDFGETAQEVPDIFYNWLIKNAIQLKPNFLFNITKNGTITLATEYKYCDRDIDINVSTPNADALLDGTITSYSNDTLDTLRPYAFYKCENLTSVDLPQCKTIGSHAFYAAHKLPKIILPEVTTITGTYNFADYKEGRNFTTKEIILPKLTSISNFEYTFKNRRGVNNLIFPSLGNNEIPVIRYHAFRDCVHLNALVFGGANMIKLETADAFSYTGVNSPLPLFLYVRENLINSYTSDSNWAQMIGEGKRISEVKSLEDFFAEYGESYRQYF